MSNALENAKKLTSREVAEKIAAEGLREFGTDRTPVAEKWKNVIWEREFQTNPIRVVCGLNNADTNGALLALFKENSEKIFDGIQIAAYAIAADEKYLFLPESEAAYAEELATAAAACGIEVKSGMVNVRESRGGAFHHMETMLAVHDIFAGGYETCTYMAVCRDEKTGPLMKVSYGTTVAEVLAQAGETANAEEIKALTIGTKLYDASALDRVIEADTPIGNGVITVYGHSCCMMHEAEKVMLRERRQSCGKCTFCREGIIQLHTMLEEITKGQGKKTFTDMLEEIGEAMTISTPCTLGQTASDFVLGTLQYFSSEYTDHIKKKQCKTNVCAAFLNIYVDPQICKGCDSCTAVCPKSAMEGKEGYIHMIDEFECQKCGTCMATCPNGAIIQTSGRVPKLPTRPTKVGKFKKR